MDSTVNDMPVEYRFLFTKPEGKLHLGIVLLCYDKSLAQLVAMGGALLKSVPFLFEVIQWPSWHLLAEVAHDKMTSVEMEILPAIPMDEAIQRLEAAGFLEGFWKRYASNPEPPT